MVDPYFDPVGFYQSYPRKVILRPGYPARAQYKSTLIWDLFGKKIKFLIGEVRTYADVGGCFGFGANSMAFHIGKGNREKYPETKVFEISDEFVTLGRQLFPYIEFIKDDITNWRGEPHVFDLITLFDVIEHIDNPEQFLKELASRTRLALLKTPMETSGEWRGEAPLAKPGNLHPDGHVNFFTPRNYVELLDRSNFELIEGHLIHSIVNSSNRAILAPESRYLAANSKEPRLKIIVYRKIASIINSLFSSYDLPRRYFGGGDYLCIVRSKNKG